MFPSTFTAFTYPNPTQRLNSPSQSSVVANVSSSLGQVEAVIGRSGNSSVLGTLIGDLRSPDSGGGGHVQAANKGGTGQTAFTKGDIFVAQSSSVISKLAVGNTNDILVADATQQAGVKWSNTAINRVAVSHVAIDTRATTGDQSVLSVNIPGSTLGTNGAIRVTVPINLLGVGGGISGNALSDVSFHAQYGNSSIRSSIIHQASVGANMGSYFGVCIVEIIAASIASSQRIIARGAISTVPTAAAISPSVGAFYKSSVIAEESSSTLGLTISFRNADLNVTSMVGVLTDGFIVEKI